ncbi:tRNA splicing endonuclease subunit sen2 [Lecanora helva]
MTTVNAADLLLQPTPKTPRPSARPNYGRIHAKALPLATYPLPPLIPHNPLSLFHIAFIYIYQVIMRPSSHPKTPYKAYWSEETSSVHVTDETAIRVLWECGFFGKGSLSRSEPSWLEREKKRRGLIAVETSEEFTIQRREERKKFKQERARKEREVIEERLKEERRSRASSSAPEPTARAIFEGMNGGPVHSLVDSIETIVEQEPAEPPTPTPMLTASEKPNDDSQINIIDSAVDQTSSITPLENDDPAPIPNQEHLQLTPSEAFFLTYALGILSIHSPSTNQPIPTPTLLTLFRTHSYFPPLPPSHLRPDDPFLLSYATYHHFRSLGWVVRPGMKFGVDWLLYLRGPVFHHAEFAVVVLPSYTDGYWRQTEERESETRKKEKRTWWWLHCVNRVQSQVRKSLVVCYVEVPSPKRLEEAGEGEGVDIGAFWGMYRVREVVVKRWIPNRERD